MKKVTRIFPYGCEWCGATGFVDNPQLESNTTTAKTIPCPVCNGSKVVTVKEITQENTILQENPQHKLQ